MALRPKVKRRGMLPTWEAKHGFRKGRCRECGERVTGRRISWCSDDCVKKHRARSDPGYQRMLVYQRDGGICRACGLDCVAVRDRLAPLLALPKHVRFDAISELLHDQESEDVLRYAERKGVALAVAISEAYGAARYAMEQGVLPQVCRGAGFWEVDHEVPIWAGGTHDLANLRTLCIPCHREATKAGAKLRARIRAREKRVEA